ncbi:MAG: ATP-binding protein [Chloracidobacterium sp.]|nr:ATP-binding protein [Chloracidobacterium sp.]
MASLEWQFDNGILSTQGCPCGYFGSSRECKCSPIQIQRYVGKISGPLMDRIDIHIDVPAVKFNELRGRDTPQGDSSEAIRERVMRARDLQLARFNGEGVFSNSAMSPKQIRTHCALDSQSEDLLEKAMLRQGLSARAHDRILKVSRTIADLAGSETIEPTHISEAINYRSLDRNYWT